MHARFLHTVVSGKFLPVAFCGATAIGLSLVWPLTIPAQEADGDFEGVKTWTDKGGTEHEIKAPNNKDSKTRQAIGKLRTDGKLSAEADEEIFENLAQYYVRSLTWKENLANLPASRKELKKQIMQFGKAPAQDLHNRWNSLALQACSEVAKDARYPRAVRINCTLMLAELDEREYNASAEPKVVVLPAATSALVDLVADTKLPIFVRLEAEVGLLRHTDKQNGMAAAMQPKVAETLLQVIQTPIAQGKDMDGQVWLRIRASEVLLTMLENKIAIDQPALASSLAELIDDDKLPAWARAFYAGDLGRLEGKSLPPANVDVYVRSLAGLMLAISDGSPFIPDETEEDAEAVTDKKDKDKKDTDKKDTKKDGDKKDEKKPAAANDTLSESAQKLVSDEMMWQLAYIRRALVGKVAPQGRDSIDEVHGLHAGASDAEKANIVKIVKHIDDSVKALNDVPNKMDKLADTLRSANQDLEAFISSPAAEAAPAQAAKDAAPRTGPPRGNAPAGASAVSN